MDKLKRHRNHLQYSKFLNFSENSLLNYIFFHIVSPQGTHSLLQKYHTDRHTHRQKSGSILRIG